ncbi:TonB-dependent receptor [Mesosutterella sp. AGMB02718]|uniref:TonB-dependent receptor n=1 Tax=Mesosutterella faecium TaxID=2925194 RepID=A0ABT7INX7_9BURK|nr:TonB-dependent receptor [Mesosutterella sp. AGMB02718]MDL2060080.1 TonB-dependent receptor [Mesosutterella sp. AGMB02718]
MLRKRSVFTELEHYFNDDWKVTGKFSYTSNSVMTRMGGASSTSTVLSPSSPNIAGHISDRFDNGGYQIAGSVNLTGKYHLFGRSHDLFGTLSLSKEHMSSTEGYYDASDAFYNGYTFRPWMIAQPDWESPYWRANYRNSFFQRALQLGTRYNFTDKWHLIAGGRYTNFTHYNLADEHNLRRSRSWLTSTKTHRGKVVPYLGLTWDVMPESSLYASYTEIFKPQSYRDENHRTLDPVTGTNYEAGLKQTWFDRRLNTSVALFRITQKNRPIYDSDVNAYHAEGLVRSRGVDFEISGEVLKDWNVFLGYTFNKSEYRETEGRRYQKGGNFSLHTPKHMFRLYTSYRLPGAAHAWTLGGGVSAQTNTSSLYGVKRGGYAIYNANVQYDLNKHCRVSLIGSNLTDRKYYYNQRVSTSGMNNYYGEPRSLWLKVDLKY